MYLQINVTMYRAKSTPNGGRKIVSCFKLQRHCTIFTTAKYSKETVLTALKLPKNLSVFSAARHMQLFSYNLEVHTLTTSVEEKKKHSKII